MSTLASLEDRTAGYVRGIRTNGLLRRRLVDLGFVPGAKVERAFASPAGDPVVYRVKGSQIALRREDADLVEVGDRRDSAKDSDGAGVRHCNAPLACRNCPSSAKGNSSATEAADPPNVAASLTVALTGNPTNQARNSIALY